MPRAPCPLCRLTVTEQALVPASSTGFNICPPPTPIETNAEPAF